jgi:hypothetical protein
MPNRNLQWIWTDDARYREVFARVSKDPDRKEAPLTVEPGCGPMTVIASGAFLEEANSVPDEDLELGPVVLSELQQLVYRNYALNFDTCVLLMPSKLYRGDPIVEVDVVFGYEYGRFYCLVPEEVGLDENYWIDAVLLKAQLASLCDAEE